MNKCPSCSLINFKDATVCKRCGAFLGYKTPSYVPADDSDSGSQKWLAALAVALLLGAAGLYIYKRNHEPNGLGTARAARLLKESAELAKADVIRFPERVQLVVRKAGSDVSPGPVARVLKELGYVEWTSDVSSRTETNGLAQYGPPIGMPSGTIIPLPGGGFSVSPGYSTSSRPADVTVYAYTMQVRATAEAGDDIRPSNPSAENDHFESFAGKFAQEASKASDFALVNNTIDPQGGQLSLVMGRLELTEIERVSFENPLTARVEFRCRYVPTKVGLEYLRKARGEDAARGAERVVPSVATLKRESKSSPWTVSEVSSFF